MKTGMLVVMDNYLKDDCRRVWHIEGIYEGATGQESVVGLTALDRTINDEVKYEVGDREMKVPKALLENNPYIKLYAVLTEEATDPDTTDLFTPVPDEEVTQ